MFRLQDILRFKRVANGGVFPRLARLNAMLTVRQALAMEVFAGSRVVAGADGLDREIRWAHPVDIPHASEWVRGGELLLTTFYGLRDDPEAQIHLCAELAEKGLAGMVVAIGGYLDAVPDAIRSAADAVD